MNQFKVIDPRGVHFNGQMVAAGGFILLEEGAELSAFIHFRQVEAVEIPVDKPDSKAKK